MPPLILASASEIRARLLAQAGLAAEIQPARVDEEAIRAALLAEGGTARDLADTLAETKALRVSLRRPEALVFGADQVLECGGEIFAKPADPAEARGQLGRLSGRTHRLLSALVAVRDGQPLWRHVGEARLTMADLSPGFIDAYVRRNWESIRHSVGAYKLEEEGVRLMSRIEGDWFTILGLPLIELLTWLRARGDIPS